MTKERMASTLPIFLLILTLISSVKAHALSLHYDPGNHSVSINHADVQQKLQLPRDVKNVTSDGKNVFLLAPQDLTVYVLTYDDLTAVDLKNALIPYGKLSFAEEFGDKLPMDLAGQSRESMSILHFTEEMIDEGGVPRVNLKTFAFVNGSPTDQISDAIDPDLDTMPSQLQIDLIGPTSMHMALKGKQGPVLGSGPIAIARDPHSGSNLLLSFDRENFLLHEYNIQNPFDPFYQRTYNIPIDEEVKKQFVDSKENYNLHTLSAPPSTIYLDTKSSRIKLSLIRLRKEEAVKRTQIITSYNNEVYGNLWTKQLLAWGAFSSLIDKLDLAFGMPEEDLDSLLSDPAIQSIASRIGTEDIFDELKATGVFSDQEINLMRDEWKVQTWKGRKWFGTVTLIVGVLSYLRIKNTPLLNREKGQFLQGLWSLLARGLTKLGVPQEKIAKLASVSNRVKTRFRAHLLRSHENQSHPIHMITDIEKQMNKIVKVANTRVSKSAQIEINLSRKGAYGKRASELMKAWNDIERPLVDIVSKNSIPESFKLLEASKKLLAKVGVQNSRVIGLIRWINQRYNRFVMRFSKDGAVIGLEKRLARLQKDMDKLKILERELALQKELTQLKGQVLALLDRSAGTSTIRSADSLGYIKATDKEFILAKAKEAVETLGSSPGKYKDLVARISKGLDELDEITKTVDSWTVKGRVHPFYDKWAKVSSAYARYWLPESAYKYRPLTWIDRNVRPDRVRLADGRVEKIAITGEHARLAITTGIADVTGDVITQWMARHNATDPEERVWGEGDNYIEFVPWNGKLYGPHFDLIGSELMNMWGWMMGMPLSYARMGFNFGSKGQVSYLRRLWDMQVKSIPNLPWAIANTYPMWLVAGSAVLLDYRIKNEENFDQDKYDDLKDRVSDRLFKFKSIFERQLFGKVIGIPYINPQYLMQSEFDRVASTIFNSSLPGRIVSAIIMPVSTGFYYHKWWADYFGFNNPTMIEVLRKMKLDGILEKIDSDGITDLTRWSDYELNGFFNLMAIFEMSRLEKERPLRPGEMSEEEIADWYAQVFTNLFGDDIFDKMEESKSIYPQKIKIIAGPEQETNDFRYKAEAQDFLTMLEKIQSGVTFIPEVSAEKGGGVFAMRLEAVPPQGNPANLTAILEEAHQLSGMVTDLLQVMRNNKDVLADQQNTLWAITAFDTLVMANMFFNNGNLPKKLQRFSGVWNASVNAWVNRIGLTGTLATLPSYFWLSDQADAHVKNALEYNFLLKELQGLLLALTEGIVSEFLQYEFNEWGEIDQATAGEIDQYQGELQKRKKLLERYLTDSKVESEDLLTSRIYRWSNILSDYAPIGMGGMAAWMITRHLLFKSSKGFVTKMTDKFAPTFLKYSFLLWFYFGQRREHHRNDIMLTTRDFFTFYSAYQSVLIELALIEEVKIAQQEGRRPEVNLKEVVASLSQKDEIMAEMEKYRQRLLDLLNGDQGEEEH